ncbi:MAG: ElyC/SanA/YdcF family protein [Legionellaceae bacterium]|nr:ElyC/SanA/YdcF family protein [Legionellaceae bacterium]
MASGIQAVLLRGFCEYLLSPFFWLFFILIGLSLYLLRSRRTRTEKRVGMILLFVWVSLYVVSTPWLPNRMMGYLEQRYARVRAVNPDVHWVLVLGGGVEEVPGIPASDALSASSLRRALEGVRLYRQLPKAELILSGASLSKPEYAVSVRYAEFTDSLQVPKAHRILITDSMNTADEARLTRTLVGDKPFYLVTSAKHMPRAMMLFEKQGLHPIAAPCDYHVLTNKQHQSWRRFLPSVEYIARFNTAMHEYLGVIWGRLRGSM